MYEQGNQLVKKTLHADNVIFNYKNFKDLYNGALQQKANLDASVKEMAELRHTFGEPNNWNRTTQERYQHIQETQDGYRIQYQAIVKEYNANASKINRRLFLDRDLPEKLPTDPTQLDPTP